MWARVIEVMLGCWLAMSPFIFRHGPEERVLWTNDFVSATLVIVLALISFWPPLRFAHVANLLVALWLIAFGFWASYPAPPALQNDIVVGLLLLMFAIIPNEATLPPRRWRDFLERKS